MQPYIYRSGIRWADLDPNFHVLHSKYYDFGASCRMAFLFENGLSAAMMTEYQVGPILLREECTFRKELRFGDDLIVNLILTGVSASGSRWSMVHEIYKNDNILSAIIRIDGAWLDTAKRKMAEPPGIVKQIFENAPKTDDFKIIHR